MKLLFTVFFLLMLHAVVAQTTLSGKVTDTKGEGIPGANITLANTYDGTTSDANGNFSFTTSEQGQQTLVVSFIGFKENRRAVTLGTTPLVVAIALEETINELEAVTITAGSFTAGDASRRTVFKAIDIATTAGATADIAGALNTLPGTQKVGETGRLFVRGGDGSETRTFIDGMLVLDAYGTSAPNTPSRGRFLPFMFKGTSFSTGGYSAEYGQALSSVLALDSKDEAEMTRTDIGILSVGADVAHTQAWDGGSVAGKVQYTNIRPYYGLINQEIDWKTPPASIEGIGAFRQRVGKQGMVKVYGNYNHSDFALYNHAIEDHSNTSLYDLTNDYRYLNGFYKTMLNEKWNVRGGLSYTGIKNNTWLNDDNIVETQKGVHAKTVFEGSLSDKVEVKAGAEVIQRNYDQAFDLKVGQDYTLSFNETLSSAFVEADVYTSNKFVMQGGARAEYNSLNQKFSVDPRVSLAYKTGKISQVYFAYGTFRQAAKNEMLRVNSTLSSEKAEHFILNYQVMENNRTLRLQAYYKRYNDLVKYRNADPLQLYNGGDGYAQGVEFFWRDYKSIKNVDYWLSYSFLDTKRNYLDFPQRAVPTFASAHNVSLVTKYFVTPLKTQVGVTYSYTTGRPYNNPNTAVFNGGKTPYYADLSVNLSYLPKPYIIVHVSCTNVLGRDNIFGYEYATTPDASGVYGSRAIRQPAPRFLFVGIFITLSKDKSTNQLPTL
ncbi:TonB-dependent receptor [Chryseolinea lacunae]|uniref:TonB-dependent receptor n=1 Tax=Chryseolinea lacunae TaxID=2801331 RepID=A0ABS1KX50_9BACT|nr:TonB-dependent receptor [Chryseolinea lacunae]MBL0743873.1 TonB-dependent receptor [Chryseolinea lacunae]